MLKPIARKTRSGLALALGIMKLSVSLRFTTRERWAIFTTFTLVILGTWLGVRVNPNWASGVGAIVVVVGVIFAASDLPKALEKRARNVASIASVMTFNDLVEQFEEETKTTLSAAERAHLLRHHEKTNVTFIEQQAARPGKRFLVVEVTIVCIGTLMNGFGQWICTALRTSGVGE